MDKQKTDQWLRESLRGYAPIPGRKGRAAFLEAAANTGNATSQATKSSGFKTGLIVLLILLGSAASFFFLLQPTAEILPQPSTTESLASGESQPKPAAEPQPKNAGNATLNHFTPDADSPKENVTQTSSSSTQKLLPIERASTEQEPESVQKPALNIENKPMQEAQFQHETAQTTAQSDDRQDEQTVESQYVEAKTNANPIGESPGEEAGEEPIEENEPIPYHFSPRQSHEWYLYYRPEVVYNIIENNKLMHNLGFDFAKRFFNNRYSLRLGLGLSFSKGYYEYATQYNAYLGSFRKLDSVTFAWDQQQYNLVPTIYTSQAEAYDDAVQTTFAKVYKQHVYLLVPLMLGYDFVNNKHWRMGLRAGPRLAVLVNTKKLTYLPDIGRNKLIQINQITPDRIKANWQMAAGFSFAVQTKKLIFEIEPGGVYYFNSVYETPNIQKAPWSLSLRLAVGFAK